SEDQISRDRFEVMESKLYRIIMRPSMIASLVLGIWLMVLTWQSYGACVWLWTKIALVVALLGFHHFCGVTIRRFTGNENPNGEKFFRIVNEVPSLLLILIVILAVVKPF
ncbi:MAG: CopD family protein, partial [Lentisphaeria bacterium]|nr:CopD family protein [Lentisphaeria bacterium]